MAHLTCRTGRQHRACASQHAPHTCPPHFMPSRLSLSAYRLASQSALAAFCSSPRPPHSLPGPLLHLWCLSTRPLPQPSPAWLARHFCIPFLFNPFLILPDMQVLVLVLGLVALGVRNTVQAQSDGNFGSWAHDGGSVGRGNGSKFC